MLSANLLYALPILIWPVPYSCVDIIVSFIHNVITELYVYTKRIIFTW